MRFLLDTNIVIAVSIGYCAPLRERMASCSEHDLVTSAVVYAEVVFGSARGKPPPLLQLQKLFEEIAVLDFGIAAARAYATLPFRRGSYDHLIAAHAVSLDLILVTDNIRHFSDIPDLKVENWMA